MQTRTKKEHTHIFLTESQIQKKVCELAARISKDYRHKKLTLVPVLKGSFIFFSDLVRRLTISCTIDFISVSSYKGKKSSGVVKLLMDLKDSPCGRDIVLVEEIVDTGYTLEYLLKNLRSRQPASIKTCVLLDKEILRKTPVPVDYRGFTVPDKFLIGYGLDYNEKYRNLPYIAVLQK